MLISFIFLSKEKPELGLLFFIVAIWYLIFYPEINPSLESDTITFWGLTAHLWGYILFLFSSAIVLLQLLIQTSRAIRTKRFQNIQSNTLFLTSGLITITFFYFNTHMHERYAHAALIFFLLYGVSTKRTALYLVCSLAYLLNLESVLNAFNLFNEEVIFNNPCFISSLYAIVLFLGIVNLYNFKLSKSYINSTFDKTKVIINRKAL